MKEIVNRKVLTNAERQLSPSSEAGASGATKSDLRFTQHPDDERHLGSSQGVRSSRIGRFGMGLGRRRAVDLSRIHARASMTTGARDSVELGLDSRWISMRSSGIPRSRWSRPARFSPRARKSHEGTNALLVASIVVGNGAMRGKRVPASAGPHVRGAKGSEGVSTFRIWLQKSFDDANAQRSWLRVFTRSVNGG